jgi:hypothetical protein
MMLMVMWMSCFTICILMSSLAKHATSETKNIYDYFLHLTIRVIDNSWYLYLEKRKCTLWLLLLQESVLQS